MPSQGGSTDKGMAGSGGAGPQGHRVGSNRLFLGTWGLEPCQGDPEPPASPGCLCPGTTLQPTCLRTSEECRAPPSGADLGQGVRHSLQTKRLFSLYLLCLLVSEVLSILPPKTTAHMGPAATALIGISDISWITKTLRVPTG